MREMGEQFVLGRTIDEAVKRGKPFTQKGYLYSYDMLGEAARTEADALRYLRAYADAIASLKRSKGEDIRRNPGISVKLSAIHPRYEVAQKDAMLPVMAERLLSSSAKRRAMPGWASTSMPRKRTGLTFPSTSSNAFWRTNRSRAGMVLVLSSKLTARERHL